MTSTNNNITPGLKKLTFADDAATPAAASSSSPSFISPRSPRNSSRIVTGLQSLALSSIETAATESASPQHSPMRRMSLKHFVFRRPAPDEVKMPTGNESTSELERQLEHNQALKIAANSEVCRLSRIENRSEHENEMLLLWTQQLERLTNAIDKISSLPRRSALAPRRSFKNLSLDQLKAERDKAKARYREQGHKDKTKFVISLTARLKEVSEPRQTELEQRLDDVVRIINGQPSLNTGHVTQFAISILELWRTAATTIIVERGEVTQGLQANAHNRFAPVDDVDTAKRFKTLFETFLRYSKDTAQPPDTTGWSYESCRVWAEKQDEKAYNPTMRRFLRSCSQAIYTGSLSHKDVLEHVPNLPSSMLVGTVPACSQEIYRIFAADGTSKIKIMLPYEFKTRTGELFANITTWYTIKCTEEMEAVALKCKVTDITFAEKK